MRSPRLRFAAAVAALCVLVAGARDAHAQAICASFFPTSTGLYADQLTVTVSGVIQTAAAHGVTGLALGGSAGTTCTDYQLDQVVARFDFQVVGVDPGEEAWFELDGAAYSVQPEDLISNPDVTPQPLVIVAGRLRSVGADGSAAARILPMNMTQLRMCASGGDGVIVLPTIDAYCQCGNGNTHPSEDCDDGDVTDGDGCSSECLVEAGWSCLGSPSVCVPEPGQTALLAVAALVLVARAALRGVSAPAKAADHAEAPLPSSG